MIVRRGIVVMTFRLAACCVLVLAACSELTDSETPKDAPAPVVAQPDAWVRPMPGEAAVLADRILRREHDGLLIDAAKRRELAEEIASVLSRIREAYPEVADVAARPAYVFGQLLLTLETWLFKTVASLVENQDGPVLLRTGHVPFDALNEELGLTVVLDASPSFGVVLLYFNEYLNVPVAAAMYEGMEGVKYAEPDAWAGDGPDIDLLRSEERWYMVARRAWGDCPAGCIHEELHFFIADDAFVERIAPAQAVAIPEFRELAMTLSASLLVFAVDLPGDHGLGNWLENHPGESSLVVPAGEYRDVGGVRFACPGYGADCNVSVTSEEFGFVVASTGGRASAENNLVKLPDMAEDLWSFVWTLAQDGLSVPAGEYRDVGDVRFSCPSGGADCEVTFLYSYCLPNICVDRLPGAVSLGGAATARLLKPAEWLTEKVIIDDAVGAAGPWKNDPYVIQADRDDGLAIDRDTLTVTVSYSGGCADHEFNLVTSGVFRESHPVQLEVALVHDAHGDRCKAILTDTRRFHLIPIKMLYRATYQAESGTIVLILKVPREAAFELVYTF